MGLMYPWLAASKLLKVRGMFLPQLIKSTVGDVTVIRRQDKTLFVSVLMTALRQILRLKCKYIL